MILQLLLNLISLERIKKLGTSIREYVYVSLSIKFAVEFSTWICVITDGGIRGIRSDEINVFSIIEKKNNVFSFSFYFLSLCVLIKWLIY